MVVMIVCLDPFPACLQDTILKLTRGEIFGINGESFEQRDGEQPETSED